MVVFSDELGRAGSASGKSASDDTRDGNGLLAAPDVQTAFALHQAERYADAARVYQALLDAAPDDPTVLHLFGVMHHQCGHSARAAELIGRAIELCPEVAAYHANLAEARRAVGDYENAAASCRAALELRPDYPEALNNLGLALHALGRNGEALAQFDAALTQRPDFALAGSGHETAQPVRTASVTQVRKPLYRRSAGRWKNYEPYLSSLFAKLEAGVPRPSS